MNNCQYRVRRSAGRPRYAEMKCSNLPPPGCGTRNSPRRNQRPHDSDFAFSDTFPNDTPDNRGARPHIARLHDRLGSLMTREPPSTESESADEADTFAIHHSSPAECDIGSRPERTVLGEYPDGNPDTPIQPLRKPNWHDTDGTIHPYAGPSRQIAFACARTEDRSEAWSMIQWYDTGRNPMTMGRADCFRTPDHSRRSIAVSWRRK